ncbi:MAG: DUF3592 domain-containing protein [Anaerolineae bacterium]|jgi:hypothetical protein|nr:DUF3592 domain-containing protein [Anaerolineae bacterium]
MASVTVPLSFQMGGESTTEAPSAYRFGFAPSIPSPLTVPVLAAGALLLVGIAALLWGALDFAESRRVDALTVATTGWVVSRDRDGVDDPIYSLSYRYTVGTTTHYGTAIVPKEVYHQYIPGKPLSVAYRTDATAESALASVEARQVVPWLAVFGLGLTALSGVGLRAAIMHTRKRRRLYTRGRVVSGQLLALRPVDMPDNRYAIEVLVRFVTPQGARVEGVRRHEIDALKITRLPDIGTPVQVIVFDASVWEIL